MAHETPHDMSDALVVGAGMCGLLCATELQAAGLQVRVLDKGRGVGGRMATRRMAGARLDHGAQFFTVREEAFRQYVDRWRAADVVREWFRHRPGSSGSTGYPRYRGVHGMTDVPKLLAEDLDVHLEERVVALARESGYWYATTEIGRRFSSRHLILTAPLPQSLMLLDTSGVQLPTELDAGLRAIRYEKGLAALVILDRPSDLAHPGGRNLNGGILSWIADNQKKGISPSVPAVTLHATATFAETHWDSPDDVRGPLMLEAAGDLLGSRVVEYRCHRWGYARPVSTWPERYVMDAELGLILAGDAFGGTRVEGAAVSGLAAAAAAIEAFRS